MCLGGGRGLLFPLFNLCKIHSKTSKIASKKVFNSSLTVALSELGNLPTDVTTHTCKTHKPLTCNIPLVTWMSCKNTQKGPPVCIRVRKTMGLPKSVRVPGSVIGGPSGWFRGCGPGGGLGGCGPDGGRCGRLRQLAVWGLARHLVCLWGGGGGLLRCFRPPRGLLPLRRGCRLCGIPQMCCDLVRCLPGAE